MLGLRQYARTHSYQVLVSLYGGHLDTKIKADAILFDPEFSTIYANDLDKYQNAKHRLPAYILQCKSSCSKAFDETGEYPYVSFINLDKAKLSGDSGAKVTDRIASAIKEKNKTFPLLTHKDKLIKLIDKLIAAQKQSLFNCYLRDAGTQDTVNYIKDNVEGQLFEKA